MCKCGCPARLLFFFFLLSCTVGMPFGGGVDRPHGGAAACFTSCFLFVVLKLLGSLSDPVNISGLAHFCEHMLFLGTKKYPKENEYSQFLSEHAGSSNAFTSGEHTNYYFDISHEHLQGALDRFGVTSLICFVRIL